MAEQDELTTSINETANARAVVIQALQAMVASANNPEFDAITAPQKVRALILVASGTFSCDFAELESGNNPDSLFSILQEVRLKAIERYESEGVKNWTGSGAHIVLADAIFTPWSAPDHKTTFDRVAIFYDEILGFTTTS